MIAGRRGGKSRVAALVAVFLALFRDYRGVLAAGERGTVMLLAADTRQDYRDLISSAFGNNVSTDSFRIASKH